MLVFLHYDLESFTNLIRQGQKLGLGNIWFGGCRQIWNRERFYLYLGNVYLWLLRHLGIFFLCMNEFKLEDFPSRWGWRRWLKVILIPWYIVEIALSKTFEIDMIRRCVKDLSHNNSSSTERARMKLLPTVLLRILFLFCRLFSKIVVSAQGSSDPHSCPFWAFFLFFIKNNLYLLWFHWHFCFLFTFIFCVQPLLCYSGVLGFILGLFWLS